MCLAIPGKLIAMEGEALAKTGTVEFGAVRREASLAFVPEANIGDYVLVHAGIAISVLDEEQAKRTFETLEELPQEESA